VDKMLCPHEKSLGCKDRKAPQCYLIRTFTIFLCFTF